MDYINKILHVVFFIICVILIFTNHMIVAAALLFCYFYFPLFRFLVGNWYLVLLNFITYLVNYKRYKLYNYPDYIGLIACYDAYGDEVFGSGKTLSAVDFVCWLYEQYNGQECYLEDCKQWVEWRVKVYSNIEILGVDYEPWTDMEQLARLVEVDNTGILNVFLMDEAMAVLNSRNFKDNFDEDTVQSIVTSRHSNAVFIYTSQRFDGVDALLRKITQSVVHCSYSSIFRLITRRYYSAYELENCLDPVRVRPLKKRFFLANDTMFKRYNTKEIVKKIAKSSNGVGRVEKVINRQYQHYEIKPKKRMHR